MKDILRKMIFMFLWISIILFIGTAILEKTQARSINGTRQIEIKVENQQVVVPKASPVAEANYKFSRFYRVIKVVLIFLIPISFIYFGIPKIILKSEKSLKEILILFAVYSVYEFIMYLPVGIIGGFYRGKLFKSLNLSFSGWIFSNLEDFLLNFIINAISFMVIYLVYKKFKHYYVILFLLMIPVSLFGAYVQPIVIDPLFNDFKPLQNAELKTKIDAICEKAGLKNVQILQVDKSKETNYLNAYMTGVGNSRRVVLWDTTLNSLSEDEILAVVAHEVGHYKLNHVPIGIVLQVFESLIILILVDSIGKKIYKKKVNGTNYKENAFIPMMLLIYLTIGFITTPVDNLVSRKMEMDADRFAIECTHNNLVNGKLQAKLMETNLQVPKVDILTKLWEYDHPTTEERIEMANAYKPWENNSYRFVK